MTIYSLAQEIVMKHVRVTFHDLLTALNRTTISPNSVFFLCDLHVYIREMIRLKVIVKHYELKQVRKFSIKDVSVVEYNI